ncbi:MAG: DUF2065 domain-containing protein [Betaproteobacteria bacterium]|nr:DUF2065 domain-containing protein [Betaproteobacteria bacterium]MDE2132435.1 DUF2065 domain-containing protein [Betaproteobacteria bacterium]MDE2212280.1 DUF2065 domain-containing protein [Betaproteobacteria bacterium]
MHSLFLTFALLLVLEGVMPFLAPNRWRETVLRICKLSDGQIRFLGFGAILVGLILMQVAT